MNKRPRVSTIKREQKKSQYFREISLLVQMLSQDEPSLRNVFVTRVELSPDSGICHVYFAMYVGEAPFKEALDVLKLYKPSLRSTLGQKVVARHTPDLVFHLDEAKEKERHIHSLLDEIKNSSE
jgi:ribosome-binding factor A